MSGGGNNSREVPPFGVVRRERGFQVGCRAESGPSNAGSPAGGNRTTTGAKPERRRVQEAMNSSVCFLMLSVNYLIYSGGIAHKWRTG